jgi:hypothetical protein
MSRERSVLKLKPNNGKLKTGNITSTFCMLAIEKVNEKNERLQQL